MAFVLTWRDDTIQTIDGYDTIEEALIFLKVRKASIMDLKYWEDTDGWKYMSPGEIDITQLKK